jgi:hypothetical protein
MADNDKEESNPARWLTQPGDLVLVAPDGTETPIGEPPIATLEYVERLKRQLKGADAATPAPRKKPGIRLHIHRK